MSLATSTPQRDCIAPPPGTIVVTPGNRSCWDATRGVNRREAGSSRGWKEAGSDQRALHLPGPLSAHPRPESRGQGAPSFRGPQQRRLEWAGNAGGRERTPFPPNAAFLRAQPPRGPPSRTAFQPQLPEQLEVRGAPALIPHRHGLGDREPLSGYRASPAVVLAGWKADGRSWPAGEWARAARLRRRARGPPTEHLRSNAEGSSWV